MTDPQWRRAALWLVAALLSILWIYKVISSFLVSPSPGDFANYWVAARLALDGAFTDPTHYHIDVFNEAVGQYYPGQLGAWVPHPPPAFVPLLPLALLSATAAPVAFGAVNLALLFVVVHLLARLSGLSRLAVGLLFLLSGRALWNQFIQGQQYILLLLSLVGGLTLAVRGRGLWGGVALGAMIPVKLVAGPIAALSLLRGKLRFAVGAGLGALATVLIALALTGPDPFIYYGQIILPRHLAGQIQDPFNAVFQAMDPLLRRLFVTEIALNPSPLYPDAALAARLGAAFHRGVWLLAALAMVGRARRLGVSLLVRPIMGGGAGDPLFIYGAAVLLAAGIAGAPATATYHYLLLVPAAALIIGPYAEKVAPHWQKISVVGLITVIGFLPVSPFLPFDGQGWLTLLAHPRLWLSLAFFAVLIAPDVGAIAGRKRPLWVRAMMVGVALAVLFAPAGAKEEPRGDGASWVGATGLILSDAGFVGDEIIYQVAGPGGFAFEPWLVEGAHSNGMALAPVARQVSRDGLWQLAVTHTPSGSVIEAISTATGERQRLTGEGSNAWAPFFDDDDQSIYFLSDRGRGVMCGTIYRLPFYHPGVGP